MFIVRDKVTNALHHFHTAHKVALFMLGRDIREWEAFVGHPVEWPGSEFNSIEKALTAAQQNAAQDGLQPPVS